MRRPLWIPIAAVAALLAGLFAAAPIHAIGYWNLPGNFCQCAGYGWGAGYHACYVLGPIRCNDFCAHNEVRLPYAPQPPYASYGCGNYNYDFRQPAQFAPVEYQSSPQYSAPDEPSLTPDALPMPEAIAPPPVLFEPPVDR